MTIWKLAGFLVAGALAGNAGAQEQTLLAFFWIAVMIGIIFAPTKEQ